MARRGGSYQYEKRQKELKKAKKKKEKAERRQAVKEATEAAAENGEVYDPDLEGIVAGPQPDPEDVAAEEPTAEK